MSEMETFATFKTVCSLEKILPNREPSLWENGASAFLNETLNFQIAYRGEKTFRERVYVKVSGGLADYVEVRKAALVAVNYVPEGADDYYETTEACVMPDPLVPLGIMQVAIPYKQWRSLWISVRIPETAQAGKYPLHFEFTAENGEKRGECSYEVEVIGVKLPETELRNTNWMHYDCIAQTHGVKPFTKKYYEVFESYLKRYTESGFNMLLTPLFTPPLDTRVGSERMTAQLVKVKFDGGRYAFDFKELKKFIRFVLKRGIKYIEFSHLFTQWGGEFCPKIMATVNGEEKRIFGWDVASDDPKYVAFLDAFLPALCDMIDEMKIRDICYFHLTDEPNDRHLPTYEKCRAAVKKHIGDMPVMDAMSHYEYYEKGLVDIPVSETPCYVRFAEHNVYPLYVYNCCGPAGAHYSNRFINMPSQRTRVLGIQMYQTGVQEYLHWGFNFFNSWLSIVSINPYISTDCAELFPAGDGHSVYPAENGANGSVRSEIINEGFQDHRALTLLESYIGRDAVLAILKEEGVEGYQIYPRCAKWHAAFRQKINALVKAQLEK
ncbi:MAG: DUF4091 domain-containing protein [Clostridia bacterium]|nr:DUF4091 domain-containing protein [Clostridia bacterium]